MLWFAVTNGAEVRRYTVFWRKPPVKSGVTPLLIPKASARIGNHIRESYSPRPVTGIASTYSRLIFHKYTSRAVLESKDRD